MGTASSEMRGDFSHAPSFGEERDVWLKRLLRKEMYIEFTKAYVLQDIKSFARPEHNTEGKKKCLLSLLLELLLTENLNNRLEGEPLRDVIATAQHLPELGARELLLVEALSLGLLSSDVALLLGVDEVEGRHGDHAELRAVLLGEVLGVVGAVEVLAGDAALGASHVTADDEVCATEVLADHHVLRIAYGEFVSERMQRVLR
jgi:hypothetical protein